VDQLCRALQKKGFTVVTYFNNFIDTPLIGENGSKRPVSIPKLFLYLYTNKRANEFADANERGKTQEAERQNDIVFLLPGIFTQLFLDNSLPPVLFVGYGAGGSALAYLANGGLLESVYGNALGVVSIEGRLWSSYQLLPRIIAEAPEEGGFFRRHWAILKNYAAHNEIINPHRVERSGPLPDSNIPVMYLVSGRALKSGKKPINKPEIAIPQRNAVKSGFYFESKGLKGFRL
jgi:hypothetical protein